MRQLPAAAAVVATVVLVACSPDPEDFQAKAEQFIESRGFSEEARLLRYSEADCAVPESTAQRTRYVCTATAADGSQWLFDVEITGKKDLKVLVPPTPLPAGSDSAPETTNGPTTTVGAGATTTIQAAAATTTTTAGG